MRNSRPTTGLRAKKISKSYAGWQQNISNRPPLPAIARIVRLCPLYFGGRWSSAFCRTEAANWNVGRSGVAGGRDWNCGRFGAGFLQALSSLGKDAGGFLQAYARLVA